MKSPCRDKKIITAVMVFAGRVLVQSKEEGSFSTCLYWIAVICGHQHSPGPSLLLLLLICTVASYLGMLSSFRLTAHPLLQGAETRQSAHITAWQGHAAQPQVHGLLHGTHQGIQCFSDAAQRHTGFCLHRMHKSQAWALRYRTIYSAEVLESVLQTYRQDQLSTVCKDCKLRLTFMHCRLMMWGSHEGPCWHCKGLSGLMQAPHAHFCSGWLMQSRWWGTQRQQVSS